MTDQKVLPLIDFTVTLKSIGGEVIQHKDPKAKPNDPDPKMFDTTLRFACVQALLSERSFSPTPLTGKTKFLRYKIAKKITAHDQWSLTQSEVGIIKNLVGELFSPTAVGAIFELLEPEQEQTSTDDSEQDAA